MSVLFQREYAQDFQKMILKIQFDLQVKSPCLGLHSNIISELKKIYLKNHKTLTLKEVQMYMCPQRILSLEIMTILLLLSVQCSKICKSICVVQIEMLRYTIMPQRPKSTFIEKKIPKKCHQPLKHSRLSHLLYFRALLL